MHGFQIWLITRSNIVTDLASSSDLRHQHPDHQHPPVDMKNQQREKKRIEDVVIDWSLYLVLLLIQELYHFITATM